jgi:hypothetical protein
MYSETPMALFNNPANTGVMGEVGKLRLSLAAEVKEPGGAELNRCFQLRSCGNGWPWLWGPMTMRVVRSLSGDPRPLNQKLAKAA